MGLLAETANPFYIWLTHEIRCLRLSKALFAHGPALGAASLSLSAEWAAVGWGGEASVLWPLGQAAFSLGR